LDADADAKRRTGDPTDDEADGVVEVEV
jgi:hypothetical protein